MTSFYGRDHARSRCRVCVRLHRLRKQPNPTVEDIVRSFGDLDVPLYRALGPHWPYRMARAKEGSYAQ